MARHLLQRFLLTLPALWLVLTLVFLMIHTPDRLMIHTPDRAVGALSSVRLR
jgi:ABC-type microcin C transport system permease subunit YejB